MSTETIPTHAEVLKNYEEAKKALREARRTFSEASKALQNRKKKKKEVIRKSNEMDDAHLAEKSRMWHRNFGDHLATFSSFDASLDNPFALDWLARIEAFEAHDTDETMVDELEDKGQTVAEKIVAVLRITDDVEYFVRRAFPNQERKLQEFGFERLRKEVVNYVPYLALLCFTMQGLTTDYLAELTGAGMPPTLPGDLETATTALALAERDQEYNKRLRIRATTQRIQMFNDLWAIHIIVSKAAKIVFRDNMVVARQFE